MKTKEQYKEFIEKSMKTRQTIQEAAKFDVINILKEKGEITFDWENDDAPSLASTQFKDDITDAYITKLGYEDGTTYADLHAYYLSEDISGVDLADELDTDWLDILDHIIDGGFID